MHSNWTENDCCTTSTSGLWNVCHSRRNARLIAAEPIGGKCLCFTFWKFCWFRRCFDRILRTEFKIVFVNPGRGGKFWRFQINFLFFFVIRTVVKSSDAILSLVWRQHYLWKIRMDQRDYHGIGFTSANASLCIYIACAIRVQLLKSRSMEMKGFFRVLHWIEMSWPE